MEVLSQENGFGLQERRGRIEDNPSIHVANLPRFVDRPTLAASSPAPWLLRFPLPELVRMNLTRESNAFQSYR